VATKRRADVTRRDRPSCAWRERNARPVTVRRCSRRDVATSRRALRRPKPLAEQTVDSTWTRFGVGEPGVDETPVVRCRPMVSGLMRTRAELRAVRFPIRGDGLRR